MGANSRQKGAAFEREVAKQLRDELGIGFKRNLEQYQESNQGDLVPDDDAFPFLIEAKHHNRPAVPAWWRQACDQALAAQKKPALIYRITGGKIRVVITARAIVECVTRNQWSGEDHLVEMTIEGFCYVAREGMANG